MERALSAAGKLFLSGEYAVLWGGTARVAAVGPRSGAYVRRREDTEVHLVLEEGRLQGHATQLGVSWEREVPAAFAFAARTLDLALRAHAQPCLGFELALSPSLTDAQGRKLGMGGSARATVLTAEAARYVLDQRYDALKLALLSHAQGQNLRGSGGDVASIFAGGLIRYRRYPVEALAEATRSPQLLAALLGAAPVELLRLNARPLLSYVYAGQSASTPSLIGVVEAKLQGPARERFVQDSDRLGHHLEEALVTGRFEGIRETTQELQALLGALGPLETEPMRQVLALARSYGGAGKISGAGGGDGCVLFAPDLETQTAMLEGLSSRGFFAFPLKFEPGLRGEARPEPSLERFLRA